MTSSRVTRLGASVLLSLMLTAGVTSSALGVSPADPTSSPSASATVAMAPTSTIAPTVTVTPGPTAGAKVAATNSGASSTPVGCLPTGWSPKLPGLDCSPQAAPPTEANDAGAAPATTCPCSISGTVTGTGGTPNLTNVIVWAESTTSSFENSSSSSNGTYSVTGLPADTYRLYFNDNWGATYLNGYYESGSTGNFGLDRSLATGVTVSANVTGINVQLGSGVHIKGTVTGTGGGGVDDINIDAYGSGVDYDGSTATISDGTYSVLVPANDSYQVYFTDPSGTYLAGWYNTAGLALDYGMATPVPVGTGDVTVKNVRMDLPWSVTLGASATSVTVGTSVTLTATANQDIGPTPYWLVILASDGTIENSVACGIGLTCTGTVTSGTLASQTYHAIVGNQDGTAPIATSNLVTVAWTPDHLVLSPPTATVAAGGTQAYTAEAVDVHGNSLGDVTSATTFTISGGGSCTGASCTSTVASDHTVTGTDGAATGTAALHVNPGPISHLTLSPANASIQLGASQTYHASGVDAYGNSLGDVTSGTTFGTSGNGSCTGSVCTPIYAGPTIIVGIDGNALGSATLHVGGSTYHAITPTRVLDTRNGTGGLAGPFTNHLARTFQVTGGSSGVPSNATAVTGNLTVTGQTSSGYLYLGPVANNNPTSSTLNFPVGDDRANAVTVALGAGGTLSITFVAPSNGPTAQGILDVTGYFTPDSSGATYHAITPTRALDTRNSTGGLSGPFTNHVARTFTVGGVPAGATAVTGNLTVTGQTSGGYLYIGPVATNNPTSSTLNFPVGDDRANAVTVALGAGGTLSITFVAPSNGPTAQAIFDVTGYFTSDMTGATYVPLNPTRVLDTRNGTGGLSGPFTNHAGRTFTVSGASSGVPTNAAAVTGNLTVTGQTSSGYLFIGPTATNNPTSSTLNFPVGDDRANAVTVALGSGTLSITFVAPSNGPTAQGIFDVTGYFVPSGG